MSASQHVFLCSKSLVWKGSKSPFPQLTMANVQIISRNQSPKHPLEPALRNSWSLNLSLVCPTVQESNWKHVALANVDLKPTKHSFELWTGISCDCEKTKMSLVESYFPDKLASKNLDVGLKRGHQVHIWGCQTCSNTADSHKVYAEKTWNRFLKSPQKISLQQKNH